MLAAAILIAAGAAVVGMLAYNAGVAQGLAQSGTLGPPAAGVLVLVLRVLFWRGPWRGGWGCGYGGVPPAFDEWHRRAHGEAPASRPPAGPAS